MSALQSSSIRPTRIDGIQRGEEFQVEVDGFMVQAYTGETVAAVLLANGNRVFNYAPDGSPRGYVCGIGRCFCCLVTIEDEAGVRACKTFVRPGMKIRTGLKQGGTS